MAVCLDQALRRFLSAWGLKSLFLASLRDRWYTFRSYCLAYIPAISDESWDSREVLEQGLRWIGLSEARISELSDAWVSYLGGLGVCGVSGVPAGAGVVSGKAASEDHESSAAASGVSESSEACIRDLRFRYGEVCNAYLARFCEKHSWSCPAADAWAAGAPGGVACIGDLSVSFDDMRADLDMGAPAGEYLRYHDYCEAVSAAGEGSLDVMSYRRWLEGAPQYPSTALSKLRALRLDLEAAVADVKSSF